MGRNILAALAALVGYVALAFAAMTFIPLGERLALAVVAGLLGAFSRTWSWLKILLFALLAASLEIFGIYLGTRPLLRQAGVHAQFVMTEFLRKSAITLLIVILITLVAAGIGFWLRKRTRNTPVVPPPVTP